SLAVPGESPDKETLPKEMPLIVPVKTMVLLPIAVVKPAPHVEAVLSQVRIVPSTDIRKKELACAFGTVQRASIAAAVIPYTNRFTHPPNQQILSFLVHESCHAKGVLGFRPML